MLARSLVAVLCGALVVAHIPGQGEIGRDQDYVDPYQGYEQETFDAIPTEIPDVGEVFNVFDGDHPEWPPIPPKFPPPHHGPHDPKVENKTIYQALKDDPRFSRVFKLINYTEDVTSLLNDPSGSITFFAVPDKALHPPKHPHKHNHPNVGLDFDSPDVDPFYNTVAAELSSSTDELEMFSILEGFTDYALLDEDDDDKERKRKIIKKIVSAVLKYHLLPGKLPSTQLFTNNTFATGLKLGDASFDSEALRVRISREPRLIHPKIRVNFYASVLYADVKTENGIVHVINHPLFPPPSIFTVLFAFSDVFSTLTSALQRVNVSDEVDWHWVRSSHTLEGAPAVTFFAPTNIAFRRLPRKLKFYLFSPFGARALKKILSLHVVPEYIFHTNWHHNASDSLAVQSEIVDSDPYSYIDAAGFDDDFDFASHFEHEEDVDRRIADDHSGNTWGAGPRIRHGRIQLDRGSCGWANDHPAGPRPPLDFPHPMCRHPQFLPPPPPPRCMQEFPRPRFPGSPFPGGPEDHEPKHPKHPPKHLPHPKPVYALNATLPTLLANHTLHVHVAQFRSIIPHGGFVTKVFVNGQWVVAADVPTRNGAVHVVNHLIRPFSKGHHEHHALHFNDEAWFQEPVVEENEDADDEWADWEEWLPQWANED